MSSDLNIENTNIKTAAGVTLDEQQKTLVGSVLDVSMVARTEFESRRPSLKKLQLWDDNGVFEDPITATRGRKEYEPQWVRTRISYAYIMRMTSFSETFCIQYGLQSAFSEIERLHHEVTDGGNPMSVDMKTRYVVKGVGKEVTIQSVVTIAYDEATGKITKVQDKWNGELPDSSFKNAFRRLNAVSVPKMVGVPKSDEEDAAKGNQ
ncbi:hypothetical protein MMC20_003691 [Loxospora ochrophaea]|nr:hypothetical protein [Loxospora ochrophaea]